MTKIIADALIALEPNGKWDLIGDLTYENINWTSTDIPKPTEAQVDAKLAKLIAGEPMELLREVRDQRILAETDWWASSDLTMTTEQTTYRQALRDITDMPSSLDDVRYLPGETVMPYLGKQPVRGSFVKADDITPDGSQNYTLLRNGAALDLVKPSA